MAVKPLRLPRAARLPGGLRVPGLPGLRFVRVRNTPGRIRLLSALVLLALAALLLVTRMGMADAREAFLAVGHDEGPMVVATGDVYLALSNMDAQVTNVLMTGRENGWLCDPDRNGSSCEREPPRFYYDVRREDAQRAMLQAARMAENDPVQLRTVQAVLDGLHQYDQRVQAAMEAGHRTDHAFNALPPDAAVEYRAATELMTGNLLPKAGNLALEGAAVVDSTYQEKRDGVLWGRLRVIVLGAAAMAALLSLQVYLAIRFRRLVNPLLGLATVALAVLTVTGASLLTTEADRLQVAKEGGFDPVLTLSRTQALGKSLDADRTRSLLDPEEADRHDQTYLDKSQVIFYIADARDLESYYTKLEQRLARYSRDQRALDFGGFYGGQARTAVTGDERVTLWGLLTSYRDYQRRDRLVRRLAASGERGKAVRAHIDPGLVYLPHHTFRAHDQELDTDGGRHRYVLDRAVRGGEGALTTWTWALPVSALVIAGLVVAGVSPRLREYLGTQPTAEEGH